MIPFIYQVARSPQGDEFHRQLKNKDGSEKIIEDLQGILELQWHLVELERHCNNIEADDGRDGKIEILRRHHVVGEQSTRRVVSVVRWLTELCKHLRKRIPNTQSSHVLSTRSETTFHWA